MTSRVEQPDYNREFAQLIANIQPLDALEREHIKETLSWIQNGVTLFRIQKPDIPNKHLVSYFIVFDEEAKKILLVDHKKAGLWLPPGGHVEVDEYPKETVRRECREELGINAEFWRDDPIFLTSTVTVGHTGGHTDVSLWYVIKGSSNETYQFDRDEFYSIRWFGLEECPFEKSDPHLQRCMSKLEKISGHKFA